MHTWTPLFSKIVDSSLWLEEDFVVKVFLTMLSKKDADQVVRMNAFELGRRCWPLDPKAEVKVLTAFKILSSPDTKRIEPQEFEGRRIERVDGGWLVLNGQYYEDMMRSINRKAYKAAKQKEYRLKAKKHTLPGEDAALRALERGDNHDAERIAATPRSEM